MYLIISIIFVILGFFYKNNKKIYNLQFIWIWILTSFNNGGIDYSNYQDMYKSFSENLNLNFLTGEKLYLTGIYLFNKMGFSFEFYTFFTTTVALFLLYLLIKKDSKNISFVSSCLIIFPLVDNIIQKRNFLMMVTILYSFIILIDKKNNYILKFFITIFCAYNFHILGIIYIIFIIIPFFSLKNIRLISCIGTILTVIFIPFLDKIAKICFGFASSKVYLYFENTTMRLPIHKVMFFVFVHLAMFLFVLFFYKKSEKNNFSINTMKINYLFLLMIPLYYYDSTFLRFYRNSFLLNYIFIGNTLLTEKIDKQKKLVEILFIIYIICLFLCLYALLGPFKYKGLVAPLFEYNYILNLLGSKL